MELRKLSQDQDRAWQSELEAVQKQHEYDSAALGSTMNEIQKLKIQLDRVAGAEANHARHAESAHSEIQSLRAELMETLTLVEKLRNQLNDSKESEACALEEASKVQMQLEVAKTTEDKVQSFYAGARMQLATGIQQLRGLLATAVQTAREIAAAALVCTPVSQVLVHCCSDAVRVFQRLNLQYEKLELSSYFPGIFYQD